MIGSGQRSEGQKRSIWVLVAALGGDIPLGGCFVHVYLPLTLAWYLSLNDNSPHTFMQVPMGFCRMEVNNPLTSFRYALTWLPESLDETYFQANFGR